jgi:4-oxalmesaconate hydratase
MIIDCHGHFTTVPAYFRDYRKAQIAEFEAGRTGGFADAPEIPEDELRAGLEANQIRLQDERGIDMTLFSPIAGLMGHHHGNAAMSEHWSRTSNDLIARVAALYPDRFVPVCQLPQSPGVSPAGCIAELHRCAGMGFVACNLNPDPSDGYWTDPPMTDRWWYPLYEQLVDLEMPAMIHVSGSCNPNFHGTGAHYINGDTTVFMQLLLSDLFRDFPTLRMVIPHGGGAVPYHWGRYRGLAQDIGRPPLAEALLDNVFFDTCVYHQPGIGLLTEVIPVRNVLFGSEMVGAVRSIDPETGHAFDDTRRYVEALGLSAEDRHAIFEGNVRRVYPRLDARLKATGR